MLKVVDMSSRNQLPGSDDVHKTLTTPEGCSPSEEPEGISPVAESLHLATLTRTRGDASAEQLAHGMDW